MPLCEKAEGNELQRRGLLTLADHTSPRGRTQAVRYLLWLGKQQILKTALTPATSCTQHGLCVWVKHVGLNASCNGCLMQKYTIPRNRLKKWLPILKLPCHAGVLGDGWLPPLTHGISFTEPNYLGRALGGTDVQKNYSIAATTGISITVSPKSRHFWRLTSSILTSRLVLFFFAVNGFYNRFTHWKSPFFLSGILQYIARSLF